LGLVASTQPTKSAIALPSLISFPVIIQDYQLTTDNFELLQAMNSRKYRQVLTGLLCLIIVVVLAIAPTNPALAEDYSSRDIKGIDLSGQDLRDSQFTRADMREANLSYTNLQQVSLFSAKLMNANLEGADLTYAVIDLARLDNANLTNAILEGVLALSARFDGAIINGADFTDVLLKPNIQEKLCQVAKGTNPVTGRDTRETLFCDY